MLVRARQRWHVRCSKEKCKKRAVFNMHPDQYLRPRKCEGCGGTKFRVIKNWTRERGNQEHCTCTGYQWGCKWTADRPPHRRGSRFCWYRVDGTPRMPGDADFEDPNYELSQADGSYSTEQADFQPDG